MGVVQLLLGREQAGLRLDDLRRQGRGCLCLIQFDLGVQDIRLRLVQSSLVRGQICLSGASLQQVELGLSRTLAGCCVGDRRPEMYRPISTPRAEGG